MDADNVDSGVVLVHLGILPITNSSTLAFWNVLLIYSMIVTLQGLLCSLEILYKGHATNSQYGSINELSGVCPCSKKGSFKPDRHADSTAFVMIFSEYSIDLHMN